MLVVSSLDDLAFALPLASVEKVVRAVEITPVPGAPDEVLGIVSVAGKMVPVLDLRGRLGLLPRAVRTTDHLVIVRTSRRTLALLVDAPAEVTATPAEITLVDPTVSRLPSIHGVVQLAGGLVMIHDVERFLSAEDEAALDTALTEAHTPIPA